jgi:hypothetical protein
MAKANSNREDPRLLGRLAAAALGSAAVLAASAMVAWPLWYLATERRGIYSALAALAGTGLLLFFLARGILRRVRARRGRRRALDRTA